MHTIVHQCGQHNVAPDCFLHDLEGQTHTLEIGPDTIDLDGQPASIASCTAEQVVFTYGGPGQTTACTPEALWYAVVGVGTTPTTAEAGQLLAENLARWDHFQHFAQLLAQQAFPSVYLPQPRLDRFTEEALMRCSGTETSIQAVACLLGQPSETVVTWLRQRGRIVEAPARRREYSNGTSVTARPEHPADLALLATGTDHTLQKEPDAPEVETHTDTLTDSGAAVAVVPPDAVPGNAKRSTYNWSEEMTAQLKKEYLNSNATSILAFAKDFGDRHCIFWQKVDSKVRQLKLPQQKAWREQEKSAADEESEDDQQRPD